MSPDFCIIVMLLSSVFFHAPCNPLRVNMLSSSPCFPHKFITPVNPLFTSLVSTNMRLQRHILHTLIFYSLALNPGYTTCRRAFVALFSAQCFRCLLSCSLDLSFFKFKFIFTLKIKLSFVFHDFTGYLFFFVPFPAIIVSISVKYVGCSC